MVPLSFCSFAFGKKSSFSADAAEGGSIYAGACHHPACADPDVAKLENRRSDERHSRSKAGAAEG